MQKIPSLYMRDPADLSRVSPSIHPEAAWVFQVDALATYKHNGTAMKLDAEGVWWSRRQLKPGQNPPPSFVPVQTDPITGKTFGWVWVGQGAYSKQFTDAQQVAEQNLPPEILTKLRGAGTYELVGPKVQDNPHGLQFHHLIKHGSKVMEVDPPLAYLELGRYLLDQKANDLGFEGVVWHGPAGQMAKIKASDFAHLIKAGA